MKNTVLMSMVAVAGLASSAMGQNYTYETRLVLDNDALLGAAGVNYGGNALLPGIGATSVGITLLVRVTSNGTFPNFGLSLATNGGGGATAPNISRFVHNDSVSNSTNALWSSPSLAFQRGQTPSGNFGAFDLFRRAMPLGDTTYNSASGNNAGTLRPTDQAVNGVAYNTGGSANADGWVGQLTTAANSGATIAGLNLSASGGSGGVQVVDTDPSAAGTQSGWIAVYRTIFVPRANDASTGSDQPRNVTVTYNGYLRAAVTATYANIGTGVTTTQNPLTAQTASVTFQVPTPGAAALLGLGGLVASRRRRA